MRLLWHRYLITLIIIFLFFTILIWFFLFYFTFLLLIHSIFLVFTFVFIDFGETAILGFFVFRINRILTYFPVSKGTVLAYVILLFLRWVFIKWHLTFVISAKTCSSALLLTQFKILSVWHIKLLCILNVEATIFWFVHILDFTEAFSLVQIISIILLHILGISFIRIILRVIWIVTGSI